MKRIFTLLTLMVGVTFASCDIESLTPGFQVYFSCDMEREEFRNISTPGHFITVKHTSDHKGYEVTYESGANIKTKTIYPTGTEIHTPYHLGLGGLIIGTLSNGNICIYDWACPKCEIARHKLKLAYDGTGHATCPKCHNVYDLNIGISIKDKSRALWQYKTYSVVGTRFEVIN